MADQNPPPADPLSRRRLLAFTAGGAVIAALIVVAAVLPAEFHKDPTGLGKATGLSRLWAPKQVPLAAAATPGQVQAREYPVPFRSDVIEIPLTSGDDLNGGNELEYKVSMKKGGTLIYSWSVSGVSNPEEFYYDFHGHTLQERETMTVATYKQATGVSANGALTAPFDGVHGWYLQNQALPPAVVRLKISGFYELIAPGQTGNEAGILANKPASQSRPKAAVADPQA